MSEVDIHNDDYAEDRLKARMNSSGQREEFVVPEHFFEQQFEEIVAQTRLSDFTKVDEFETPSGYFVDAEMRILAGLEAENPEEQTFFNDQQKDILARIKLEELGLNDNAEFGVPSGYFESSSNEIVAAIAEVQNTPRVIPFHRTGHARMWMGIAAAACIAFLVVMIWPQNTPVQNQPSFAELLEKTELDESDLEYFATDEEYDQLLLSEIELLTDTLIADSVKVVDPLKPLPAADATQEKEKKDKKDIKPKDKKKTPSFDDLTEDEILEFLLEEGGDDILDDL
ncbi:MAG: hypothetical protein ACKVOK_09290 [Flavobacteriales bacterium]